MLPAEAAVVAGPVQPPKFVQELDLLIRARYPLLYLVSWEEQRLEALLEELARNHGKDLYTWSITRGLRRTSGTRGVGAEAPKAPLDALAAIDQLKGAPSLVVLKDFHPFLSDPAVVRALRELAHGLKSTYTTVILLAPTVSLPPELEKEVTVLDVPLPTFQDLFELLRDIVRVVRQGNKAVVELNKEQAEQLVKAALGLTLSEAENAFAKALANDARLDADDIQQVLDEKRQVVRKSGLLEYFPPAERLDQVGGLENLKAWLGQRSQAFGERAKAFGLPAPKGLLLLGVQGCGKSVTAKAVAAEWRLPLLRLDLGRIYSGLLGSSEQNLRTAIRVAEGVAPAVLWVDELEKALSGIGASGLSDGGVADRVFGAFLTWLQEKTAPVFVVATANRIDGLPPELLRKGRFDEIFFVDLPAAREREAIFAIHLERRHRVPARFDLAALAERSEGFSGAEIEQGVVSALYQAFAEGIDVAQRHLELALQETVPLSTTLREEIARLRQWASGRTRPAGRPASGSEANRSPE